MKHTCCHNLLNNKSKNLTSFYFSMPVRKDEHANDPFSFNREN